MKNLKVYLYLYSIEHQKLIRNIVKINVAVILISI